MPKRSAKPGRSAKRAADEKLAGAPAANPSTGAERPKNPAAVALGRLGGLKGGPARAAKLSKKRLTEIGKKAAHARWKRS